MQTAVQHCFRAMQLYPCPSAVTIFTVFPSPFPPHFPPPTRPLSGNFRVVNDCQRQTSRKAKHDIAVGTEGRLQGDMEKLHTRQWAGDISIFTHALRFLANEQPSRKAHRGKKSGKKIRKKSKRCDVSSGSPSKGAWLGEATFDRKPQSAN